MRLLKENALKIEELANQIIVKRSEYAMAEAELLDAEDEAWKLRFGQGGRVTLARRIVESDTRPYKKALLAKKYELHNLTDLMKVLDTSNNNLKLQIRLAGDEMRNLSLLS